MPTVFRPDADPETTSVDGYVQHSVAYGSSDWSAFTGGVGNSSVSTWHTTYARFAPYWVSPWTPNLWSFLQRGIILFDTSEIPDGVDILSATLSLYGTASDGSGGLNNPNLNIYSSNPDSDTELIAADYTTLGTTAFCNTPIDIASWVDNDWNDFVLNDAGIAAISKTGITKFGFRLVENDVEGTEPTWWGDTNSTGFYVRTADYSDGSYAPKLTVTLKSCTTFYPDASPETTCLDGSLMMRDSAGVTWATVRTGVLGDINGSDTSSTETVEIHADNLQDKWYWLQRGVAGFNTASIPDDVTILSATLSLYGADKRDHLGITPNINIYSTSLTNNTDISPTDEDLLTNYQAFGSTAFSTAISYDNWDAVGWNDFVLNQNGIDSISKTGVTNFGVRNANYDVANTEPAWTASEESYLTWWTADWSSDYAPKLIVCWAVDVPTVTTQAVTEIHILYALGNGNITATGGENADLRGICWKISSGPTVADDKMQDSGSFGTGAFTNWITPTLPETLYYVKAYAHNSYGYGYGDEVTFTAYAQDGGYIWIETTKFHFIDEIGTEQDLENFDQDLNTTDSVQFSEILLTPKTSSSGAEGTTYYDSDDDHLYLATEV